jgi:hypothetical protein
MAVESAQPSVTARIGDVPQDGPDGFRVAAVIMTLTNNGGGGKPVSTANLTSTSALCREHGVPLLLDAAVRGERLARHPAGGRLPRPQPAAGRRGSLPARRRLRDEREEGRHRPHRRLPGPARHRPRPALRTAAHRHRRLPHLRRTGRTRPGHGRPGPERGHRPGVSARAGRGHRVSGGPRAVGGGRHRRAARAARALPQRRPSAAAHPVAPVPRPGAGLPAISGGRHPRREARLPLPGHGGRARRPAHQRAARTAATGDSAQDVHPWPLRPRRADAGPHGPRRPPRPRLRITEQPDSLRQFRSRLAPVAL